MSMQAQQTKTQTPRSELVGLAVFGVLNKNLHRRGAIAHGLWVRDYIVPMPDCTVKGRVRRALPDVTQEEIDEAIRLLFAEGVILLWRQSPDTPNVPTVVLVRTRLGELFFSRAGGCRLVQPE